jgi:hypothetical protein
LGLGGGELIKHFAALVAHCDDWRDAIASQEPQEGGAGGASADAGDGGCNPGS